MVGYAAGPERSYYNRESNLNCQISQGRLRGSDSHPPSTSPIRHVYSRYAFQRRMWL